MSSINNFSHHQLIQLANSGLGFTVDATLCSHHQLIQLANSASSSQAQITIINFGSLSHHQLIQLGNAGSGNVILG